MEIGDLRGVIQKINYIKQLEKLIRFGLTLYLKSPQVDNGYECFLIYNAIDPLFGPRMMMFDELIEERNKRELKIILDFVLSYICLSILGSRSFRRDL